MSVDGHPGIRVTTSELHQRDTKPGTRVVVPIVSRTYAEGDPRQRGREPDAICEGCGGVGTIGRASRTDGVGNVTEVHRFCRECWPEQSARYRARWEEQDRLRFERVMRGIDAPVSGAGPGTSFEAATWHSVLSLVRELEHSLRAPMSPSADDLGAFADEIRSNASQFDGDMPWEVEAFVRRYGTSKGS